MRLSAIWIGALLALVASAGTPALAQSTDTATPAVKGELEPTGELVAKPEAPPIELTREAVDASVDEALEEAEKSLDANEKITGQSN